MRRPATICLLTAVAAAIALPTPTALAQDSGLSSMHAQRREAGKVCMIDHFHYGSGSGSTKPKALADAIGAWQGFTDFEYGGRWASWRRSASKQIKYSSSPTGFTADISSRPCK